MEQNKPEQIHAKIDHLYTQNTSRVKAVASVAIADAYAIHGIKIVDGEKGLFVAMPQSSYKKGEKTVYADIFHPITAEARTRLIDAVYAAYEERLHREEIPCPAEKINADMSM